MNAGYNLGFNIAFNVGFAMAFVTAMFAMFYVTERVTRAKLLQILSGVSRIVFWLTSFVIDYVQFVLISLLLLGVLFAYQEDGFSTYTELERNFFVLLTFGFAAIPFTYIGSFLFPLSSTGLVRLSIVYIISGVFCFMTHFILNNEVLELEHIAGPLGWAFLIFPHFSLAQGMSKLSIKHSTFNMCDKQCSFVPTCSRIGVMKMCEAVKLNCSAQRNAVERAMCSLHNSCCHRELYSFDEGGLGRNLVALAIIGVISFLSLFAIEYRWLQRISHKLKKSKR